MSALDGRVVALICRGSEDDRAIAVALAEAGANIAIGTITRAQAEEFSTASIANEVWAIGRGQLNRLLAAAEPTDAASFAAEVVDTLGHCDVVVIAPGPAPVIPFDELSRDEWEPIAAETVTASLVSAQAFWRILDRAGGGAIFLVIEAASHRDVAGSIIAESLRALSAHLGILGAERGIRSVAVSRQGAPEGVIQALR
jgi:NAD(P)-dependent dehydrogenase (short-subunit alcohol dehydrogenase family)